MHNGFVEEVMHMYCRHCGEQLNDDALTCTNCGKNPINGFAYCSFCGAKTTGDMTSCQNCGITLKHYSESTDSSVFNRQSDKSKFSAGMMAVFLGPLGIHDFYLGNTDKGWTKLLITVLSGGIGSVLTGPWSIYDAYKIFSGQRDDADGKTLR